MDKPTPPIEIHSRQRREYRWFCPRCNKSSALWYAEQELAISESEFHQCLAKEE